MSLVISLRKGQDFFVGDEQFVVEEVRAENDFTIRRTRDGKQFGITDRESMEVLDDVMISSGEAEHTVRLSIDAPREVRVLRGDKYRSTDARMPARAW